jgi:hypothetical protein
MVQTESQLSNLLPQSAEVIGTSAGFRWSRFLETFFIHPGERRSGVNQSATTVGLYAQREAGSMERQVSYRTVMIEGVSIFYREADQRSGKSST